MIEEQELDDWFADERERLESAYYSGAEAHNDPDKLKTAFDEAFQRLLAKYQEHQAALLTQQRRHAALHKPIARLAAWRDEQLTRIAGERKRLVENVRVWLLHQRVKRAIRAR